jgi:hypothetical protein
MTSAEQPQESNSQRHSAFEAICQKAADLQIVEGFLSAVERKFLKVAANRFEVKQVKDALLKLQDLKQSGSGVETVQANADLDDLLASWRSRLTGRDLAIETEQIRRFCDEFKKPFDSKVFTALARFYLSLPHSLSTQSKYDFAVTRLFLKQTACNVREIKFERETVIARLIGLGEGWNIHASFTRATDEDVIEVITKFDEFIFEAEFITNFEELVQSRIFENLREFKSRLGELFYHPSVTASAIECNVFVGNIFAELLAQENEKLSRIISNELDFAGVLHDTSPTAIINSSKILENIRTDNRKNAGQPDEDATHIWEWLQSVCARNVEKSPPADDREPARLVCPAKERIAPLLEIIDTPGSDKTPLFEYLQKSVALKALDFGIFLAPDTAELHQALFRATLCAVIWAEELRTHELMKNDKLTDETNTEISLILDQLQELSEHLRSRIEQLESDVSHNLLYVSNQLLESRLKLERAIVRYSRQNLGISGVGEEMPEPSPVLAIPSFVTPTFQVNPWLLAACLLVVFLSFGAYFSVDLISARARVSHDLETVEIHRLPGTEYFTSAQRVRRSLYLTAGDSWKTLDDRKQREILGALLRFPGKIPIANVVITDAAGNEMATASADLMETSHQLENLSD